MEITITDTTKIEEIQTEFQKEYPFLKIEFVKASPKENAEVKAQYIPGRATVGMVRHYPGTGKIDMSRTCSIKELQAGFLDTFGLYAEVFRKSGRVWIETTLTADWTLFKQNQAGQQIS